MTSSSRSDARRWQTQTQRQPGTDEAAPTLPDGEFYDVLRERWPGAAAARTEAEAAAAPENTDAPDDAGVPEPQDFEDFWADAVRRGGLWWPVEPEPATLNESIGALDFGNLAGGGPGTGVGRALTLLPYPSLHFYDGGQPTDRGCRRFPIRS